MQNRSISDEEIHKYVDGESNNHAYVDARHVVRPLPPRASMQVNRRHVAFWSHATHMSAY